MLMANGAFLFSCGTATWSAWSCSSAVEEITTGETTVAGERERGKKTFHFTWSQETTTSGFWWLVFTPGLRSTTQQRVATISVWRPSSPVAPLSILLTSGGARRYTTLLPQTWTEGKVMGKLRKWTCRVWRLHFQNKTKNYWSIWLGNTAP